MVENLFSRRQTREPRRRARKAALLVCLAALAWLASVAYLDHAAQLAARDRQADLECLARNVYYEARGEPLAGQYAVAEVTMNRVVSPLFPDSVCAVVHSRGWDDSRERFVGAFSWTELESLAEPNGYEWRRARAVASTVYDNREAPLVDGALFYHATRISPDWARKRTHVARIGRHVFYE